MVPSESEVQSVRGALIRFNAITLSVMFALMLATGLALATLILLIKGGPNPGATLVLLSQYLPGYSITLPGALVGFFWVFLFSLLLTIGPAWTYYKGSLKAANGTQSGLDADALLRISARIHVPSFAASAGLFFGSALFMATAWLVAKHREGEPLGPHLELLKHYLPGYSVSYAGALLGFVWLFAIGFVAFAVIGWIYNRLIGSAPSPTRGSRTG